MRAPRRLSCFVACVAASLAHAADKQWNVADTGQPYVDAAFTVTEGTWMSLDVSPDGRTLVFDLLGDVYTMPSEGGEARAILSGPAMQRSPTFSRDGRRLAFISDAGGTDNVWIANADGSSARAATHETVDVMTGATWGPDDESVAGARMESVASKLHASEIRLYDLRGGRAGRVLVEAPANGENVHEAEFSPDGRHVYYTEKVSPPSASIVYIDANHPNFAIKRRELATGAIETVVQGFGGATTPRLSRDGKRLAFVRRVKDKTVLFVLDPSSGEQRPVYDALDRDDQADFIGQGHYYPRYGWFPDGRHLAIWGKGKLVRVDVDTLQHVEIPFRLTARHPITTPPRFEHELAPRAVQVRAIRQPAVSPRGDRLAFIAVGRLWQQVLPKGELRRVTNGEDLESEPSYSPSGNEIAYVEWDDERGAALKVAPAQGQQTPRTVLSSRGAIRQPAFSPDGTMLVYHIGAGDKCLGGFREKTGIYRVAAGGGPGQFVVAHGESPQFSPDQRRIYFNSTSYEGDTTVHKIESVTLDGFNRRTHAVARGADTLDLRLSPDLGWIGFKENQQYYVMRYRESGAPLVVSANAATATAVSALGGYGFNWTATSEAAYWTLGAALYRYPIGRHGADASLAKPLTTIALSVPGDAPGGIVAFTNARIITMKGAQVIERGTLVVDGNRITAVGDAATVSVPGTAKVIDATGKTIMPGLVNMHGHIDDCYYSSAGLMPEKEPSMYASLAFGITTNYDPYTSELARYSITEMNQAGLRVGPRSINSGSVAYGRAGKSDAVYVPIEDLDDAQRFMARKAALGGRVVKSYRQPARRQRQQLVKAGREAGIMLDVEGESHFYNNLTMILDGHTAIEHNFPVATYYDDVVQLMRHAQSATTPTLIIAFGELMGENYMYQTTRAWEDPKLKAFVQSTTSGYSPLATPYSGPAYARGMTTIHVADELWDIGFRSVARSMKKLDDAGVIVNSGSHGQIHGLDQHWEMWLMAMGGMGNLQVLRTSTLNGARTLALDRQIGSLEPGKLADLIVLDRNPLDDIRNTNTVRYTMVNGRLYDSLSMNEIGNHDLPRTKFYWELPGESKIEWNESWGEH